MFCVMGAAPRGYVIYRKDAVRDVFGHGAVSPPCANNRPIVFRDLDAARQVKYVLDISVCTTGDWEGAMEIKNGELSIAENIRLSVELSCLDMEYCEIREARENELI